MSDIQNIIGLSVAISTVGGAWLTLRKIAKDAAKSRKEQESAILQQAKEEDQLIRLDLEAKIKAIRSDLHNLQSNVNKDLNHLKETYNGEIRNLGQKIEDLRSELKNQHGQLVGLLTEMIKKRN